MIKQIQNHQNITACPRGKLQKHFRFFKSLKMAKKCTQNILMYLPRILPLPPPAFNGGLDDNSGESANNAALLL